MEKNTTGKKGKLRIDKERCVGCSYCKLNCTNNSMLVEDAIARPSSECSLCGVCVWVCPVNAIAISF